MMRRVPRVFKAFKSTLAIPSLPSVIPKPILAARKVIQDKSQWIASSSSHSTVFSGGTKTSSPSARKKNIQWTKIESLLNKWEDLDSGCKHLHTLAQESRGDDEMLELSISELQTTLTSLQQTTSLVAKALIDFLSPFFGTSQFPALIEIKAGAGGQEAALFAQDVLEMYLRLADRFGWDCTVLERNQTDTGGCKDAVVQVEQGKKRKYSEEEENEEDVFGGPYGRLRWESGVHRVQRVPATESKGRTHTSTVGVVVLPMDPHAESATEATIKIDPKDIKTETMRSSGPGGQHVNKTESAVRITHIPSGIVVHIQETRSQHENKARCYQILRSRLLDRQLQEESDLRAKSRRAQVRGFDRGDKIRTYNYPDGRVTDHRLPLTLNVLADVLEGGSSLDTFAEALKHKEDDEKIDEVLTT